MMIKYVSDHTNRFITDSMSITVIDEFKMIYVDHDAGKHVVMSVRFLKRLFK